MTNSKIKNEIKITQISDFHSNTINNLDYLMTTIRDFDPDFIIMTGDINDYGVIYKFEKAVEFIEEIKTLNKKTFYVLGNHEEVGPMLNEFIEKLIENNVIVLLNSDYLLNIKQNKVYIFGTKFYDFDYSLFNGKEEYLNIILAHHSRLIRENSNGLEDFVFSGHTHGGQVRVPFFGALWAPGEGYFPKYDKGEFEYKNFKIHIDSGLGNTRYNLRILNRIQFSNITLKAPII